MTRFLMLLAATAITASALTACSGAPPPKPLPGGPPPEYEAPRAFTLPGASAAPTAPSAPSTAPPATAAP